MEDALRAAGYRITPQRRAILNVLAHTDAHPSARDVFQETKRQCPGISLATVYNTLDTLAGLGLIKIMDFQYMDNRHETNLAPHINLICTVCGKIQDFQGASNIHVAKADKDYGFQVEDFRMEYYGICADCRAKAEGNFET